MNTLVRMVVGVGDTKTQKIWQFWWYRFWDVKNEGFRKIFYLQATAWVSLCNFTLRVVTTVSWGTVMVKHKRRNKGRRREQMQRGVVLPLSSSRHTSASSPSLYCLVCVCVFEHLQHHSHCPGWVWARGSIRANWGAQGWRRNAERRWREHSRKHRSVS